MYDQELGGKFKRRSIKKDGFEFEFSSDVKENHQFNDLLNYGYISNLLVFICNKLLERMRTVLQFGNNIRSGQWIR